MLTYLNHFRAISFGTIGFRTWKGFHMCLHKHLLETLLSFVICMFCRLLFITRRGYYSGDI